MKIYKSKIIVVLSLVAIFTFILLQACYRGLNLEYLPYDGDFQTFNPSRRIFNGELPSRDFNPYLGLGLTYFNAFFVYLFGSNFAASKFGVYFLSVSSHFGSLILLFCLVGCQLRRSILLASVLLFAIFLDRDRLILFWEIIEPSRSNLSLRSFLPFLTASSCLILYRVYDNRPQKLYLKLYFLLGCLVALQPFWSNDYGIPSTFALIFIVVIRSIVDRKQHKNIQFIYFILGIFITFVLALYLLTAGTPINWFRDNFQGVAVDQFWYFLWYDGKNKVFELRDIFNSFFFYIYFAAIVWILRYILCREYVIRYLLLVYISLTAMGAGILASVGGTIGIRYYTPSIFLSLFIIPLAIYLLVIEYFPTSSAQRAFGIVFWQIKISSISNSIDKNLKLSSRFITIYLVIYYCSISILSFVNTPDLTNFIWHRENFFFVEELGGWLPHKWQSSIEIARDIDRELTTEAATKRILSTYTSGMDTVAGAINPTQIDYIIHALGDRSRSNYLEKYRASQPKYITTLREEYRSWETWVRRTNWWFYREFVLNYKPINATFYNLIWQRLEQPIAVPDYPIYCTIIPQDDRRITLQISSKNTTKIDDKIYYLDVAIEYNLKVTPSLVPIVGKRGLINITEKQTAFNKAIGLKDNYSYGIPPQANIWYIPVEHRLGTTSILELSSYPQKRAKLRVTSCQAKLFVPSSHFMPN
jgi:hypothetical protein